MPASIGSQTAVQLDSKTAASRYTEVGLVLQILARYLLGALILSYGLSKLLRMQFQVPAWNYTLPLGQQSGMLLAWAFLGYAPWFQFLLGALETGPGLLLLFRRTRRLGALLLFPTLLNVVLMNFAMHLWKGTQEISVFLLLLDIYLLACDFPMYRSFLYSLLPRPTPLRNPRWRLTANILTAMIPVAVLGTLFYVLHVQQSTYITPVSDFTGEHQINRAGTWSVEQIEVSGKEVPMEANSILYFDFAGRCIYKSRSQTHSGNSYVSTSRGQSGQFKANRSRRTFEISGISFGGDPGTVSGAYSAEGSQLILQGKRQAQPFRIVLRKSNWGRM